MYNLIDVTNHVIVYTCVFSAKLAILTRSDRTFQRDVKVKDECKDRKEVSMEVPAKWSRNKA